MLRATLSLLLAVAVALPAVAAAQQPRRPTKRPGRQQPQQPANGEPIAAAPTIRDMPTIVPKLQSTNPDEVRAAIDLLSVIDRPEVVPPLAELLRSGKADPITDRALEALGALGHASAIEVLTEFTHHRRSGARRRAFVSLAAIHDGRVPALVERGLADSDRSVRGAAALALGEMNARASIDPLFRAFERGVVEAAIAIGKLGDAQSVNRFSQHLGRQPLSIMLSGYDEFLKRRDINERVKLDIVARLGEVSGPMVKRFLQDFLRSFPDRDRSALKRAVDETIRRIPDGPAAGQRTAPAGAAPAGPGANGGGR